MTKKITEKRLYNIALYYVSRFETTTVKLQDILEKRLLTAQIHGEEIPPQAKEWIGKIISRMVHLGYINNTRFAENTFQKMIGSGKSIRSISYKLQQAGLNNDILSDLIKKQEKTSLELDLIAAIKFVKKRKLGIYRPESTRAQYAEKDLAALGRAGFSYEIALKALKEEDS